MYTKQQYINGNWVGAISGNTRKIINPFNQEEIAIVPQGDALDAKAAIDAARKNFESGEWSQTSATARGEILRKISILIERDKEELAILETLNTGKILKESQEDMEDVAEVFRYYAEIGDKHAGVLITSPVSDAISRVVREPVGVCGQITPWNYPLAQASWKLAPALVAGNTVIMKPSEITPLTTIKLFALMEEAGLPRGVANLVLGPGSTVGAELTRNRDVDLISFTGGLETGKQIMQAASNNVKKLVLELGGKNPNIIFADADIETAVDQALNGVFSNAGQICSAASRLILQEEIHDAFLQALVQRVKKIKLGSGLDKDTRMGPLISAEHLNKIEKTVARGIEEGATLVVGGNRPSDPELQKGFFFLPTIFADCTTSMRIVQEEAFGPILTVEKFRSEEDAIRLANDSLYGLAGAVWTKDTAKAERCAAKMRMGTVWINDYNFSFAQAPWGGFKQSGIGRELGKAGLEEYTQVKHIYQNLKPKPYCWF